MITMKMNLLKRDQFRRFFTEADQKGLNGQRVQALSRFGAYVMTAARTSIRKRKKISEPGKAPNSHVGYLRRGIEFDKTDNSVYIGPVPLNGRALKGTLPLLEYGGQRYQPVYLPPKSRRRRGDRMRRQMANARYRARPFMQPAFEKTIQKHSTTNWLKSVL